MQPSASFTTLITCKKLPYTESGNWSVKINIACSDWQSLSSVLGRGPSHLLLCDPFEWQSQVLNLGRSLHAKQMFSHSFFSALSLRFHKVLLEIRLALGFLLEVWKSMLSLTSSGSRKFQDTFLQGLFPSENKIRRPLVWNFWMGGYKRGGVMSLFPVMSALPLLPPHSHLSQPWNTNTKGINCTESV